MDIGHLFCSIYLSIPAKGQVVPHVHHDLGDIVERSLKLFALLGANPCDSVHPDPRLLLLSPKSYDFIVQTQSWGQFHKAFTPVKITSLNFTSVIFTDVGSTAVKIMEVECASSVYK